MSHKRSPIGSENVTDLARVIRGYITIAFENVNLWHERDISHSSAKRIIIPSTMISLDYMLDRFDNIVKNSAVSPESMRHDMDVTYGLTCSQHILSKLTDHGMTRGGAYGLAQPKATYVWDHQAASCLLLDVDEKVTPVLSKEGLDDAFDYHRRLKNVNTIFEHVGLG